MNPPDINDTLKRLLDPQARSGHTQIIGGTGSGKSQLLAQMIKHDIQNNNQLCLIDPYTGLYADILAWCESKDHKALSFDCLHQSQRTSYDDFMKIMDHNWTLVNLAVNKPLSQANAQKVGSFIINHIYTAAQNRPADYPYYLYIDGCEFLAKTLVPILDEGRKFGLYLILAIQSFSQLKQAGEDAYQTIMANTKTKVGIGRLSPEDTQILSQYT